VLFPHLLVEKMIELLGLTHNFSGFSLGPIDLEVNSGEFFILLGPSGSGKTVILESIVGARQPDSGKVLLDGVDVTHCAPEHRQVGIVYQDQALFPHLSVKENINFGVRYQRTIQKSQISIETIIETLGLGNHLEKFPQDLSGGEKQRVALARALAIQPRVLLLDEPLSALDPCFRGEIQRLLKKLHTSLGTTFLMVTHDFNEAFYLGDRVGIISKGRVKQVGIVDDVFLRPKNVDVGKFVGMKNIFQVGDGPLSIGNLTIGDNKGTLNGACGLRPEDVEVNLTNAFHPEYYVGSGILHSVVKQGFVSEVTISSGNTLILAHGDERRLRTKEMDIGAQIYFAFSPESLHHFPE
jgi:molybdate/tungstate transport system ATP-binding protein